MISTQQILSAIGNMQSDVQSDLPVMPNNGNPRGANNMPQQNVPRNTGIVPPHMQQQNPQANPQNRFAWLQASPAMSRVREMLDSRSRGIIPLQQQPLPSPAVPQAELPIMPMRQMPVRPM